MIRIPRARPVGSPARGTPPAVGSAAFLLVTAILALPACMPPQVLTLRSGLDSLRAVVDTMAVRDSLTYRLLAETRREVAEQRDILLSTRATTGTTTQELFEQMGRLEGKLDEVMGRFQQVTQRAPTQPGTGIDPNQLFDQATQDLTQGRYALAHQQFEEFVTRFPATELSDNAQYGVGECLFAQSKFDSAAIAYARVDSLFPQGDKVPAALYKLALSHEKLGRASEAKSTLEALIKRYPLSGEAQLARERLGTNRRR
jgi:tol-pal system protein YbgF